MKQKLIFMSIFLLGLGQAFSEVITQLAFTPEAEYNGVEYDSGLIQVCDGETVSFTANPPDKFRVIEVDPTSLVWGCYGEDGGPFESYEVISTFGANLTPSMQWFDIQFDYVPGGNNIHHIAIGSNLHNCFMQAQEEDGSAFLMYSFTIEVFPSINIFPNPSYTVTTDAAGNDFSIEAVIQSTSEITHRWEIDDNDPSTSVNFTPIMTGPTNGIFYSEPNIDLSTATSWIQNYFRGECVILRHIMSSPCFEDVVYEREICNTSCSENGEFTYEILCFDPISEMVMLQLNTSGNVTSESWYVDPPNLYVNSNNQIEIPLGIEVTITREYEGFYDYSTVTCDGVFELKALVNEKAPCQGATGAIDHQIDPAGNIHIVASVTDNSGTITTVSPNDFMSVLVNGSNVTYYIGGGNNIFISNTILNPGDVIEVEYSYTVESKTGGCCYFYNKFIYDGKVPTGFPCDLYEGISVVNPITPNPIPDAMNFYSEIFYGIANIPVGAYDYFTVDGIQVTSSSHNLQIIPQSTDHIVHSISPLQNGEEVCVFYSAFGCDYSACFIYDSRASRKASTNTIEQEDLKIEFASQQIRIDSKTAVQLKIVNILGHIIYDSNVKPGEYVDVAHLNLPSGIYIMEAVTNENRVSKKVYIN